MRQYREAMRAFAEQTELGVWYSRLEGEALVALARSRARPQGGPQLGGQPGQGALQGQHEGVLQADHGRRRRGPYHRRPAAHRPAAGPVNEEQEPAWSTRSTSCSGPTGAPCRPTGATCSSSTASWT